MKALIKDPRGRKPTLDRALILTQAIDLLGGQEKFAKRLRITYQAVSQWRRVPSHRVLKIEALTGISRYRLRPDLYGREPR